MILYAIWASGPVFRENQQTGNFRELSGSATRLATLSDAGRITESGVADEIDRLRQVWNKAVESDLDKVLGERVASLDLFDRLQLECVIKVCRQSDSLSDAGRRLFGVSRQEKSKPNDADRLRKYLASFSLDWQRIMEALPGNTGDAPDFPVRKMSGF